MSTEWSYFYEMWQLFLSFLQQHNCMMCCIFYLIGCVFSDMPYRRKELTGWWLQKRRLTISIELASFKFKHWWKYLSSEPVKISFHVKLLFSRSGGVFTRINKVLTFLSGKQFSSLVRLSVPSFSRLSSCVPIWWSCCWTVSRSLWFKPVFSFSPCSWIRTKMAFLLRMSAQMAWWGKTNTIFRENILFYYYLFAELYHLYDILWRFLKRNHGKMKSSWYNIHWIHETGSVVHDLFLKQNKYLI